MVVMVWMLPVVVWGQSRTVIDLQPFRTSTSVATPAGRATLVNLNHHVNTWHVLTLARAEAEVSHHLENPYPEQQVLLDPAYPDGIVIVQPGERIPCAVWAELDAMKKARQPYVPLCDGLLLLRNKTQGHKTSREWASDFLRRYVPGGERITSFVRGAFYKDAFLSTAPVTGMVGFAGRPRSPGAPARPAVDAQYDGYFLAPQDLGIDLEGTEGGRVLVGRWYPAAGLTGIYVSAMQSRLVSPAIAEAQKGMVRPLDDIEMAAMVYMVAFDLDYYEVGFALGTEHPRVDWSDRIPAQVRDPSLPGPDGIGTVEPLVNTGMVSPVYVDHVAAVFTGGFKRYHGAFRRSELALTNRGSHYGFIENGVVMSMLQPGLATALMYVDGQMDLKTWAARDTVDLWRIRHARQNGVPLIEWNANKGMPRPGALVGNPALGNWSGSVDGRYRTLRAGIGLQETNGHRFLLYGYFSSATPSAMARVFQAYGCRYALMTDMNALEHTYLSVFTRKDDGQLQPHHLVRGMEVLDKAALGQVVPRFVGYADNRDFFYLLKKEMP